jgi:hypothetical protein
MKRFSILVACLMAACGGGGNKANPAAATTFNYAAGTTGAPPAGTLDSTASALASVSAFQSSASVDSAMNVGGALFSAADAALGGSFSVAAAPMERVLPLFRQVRSQALAIGDVPGSSLPSGCGVVASGTVTFDPAKCTVTQTSTTGETVTATLSGHVTGAPGSVVWDLAITANIADPQMTLAVQYSDLGNLAVTDATAKAHQEASIHATARANNQTLSLGLAQAADLDVTHRASCATGIDGGTFEAKRVWTELPSQVQGDPQYRNKGVKLTWTGCGTATAQFAVN